jgi:hypothetical protein
MRSGILIAMLLVLAYSNCNLDSPGQYNPGDSAKYFLAEQDYTKLKIEIQSVNGYPLTNQTQTNLTNFLQTYLHKPGGITIVTTSISSPGQTDYSFEDIQRIEKNNRQYYSNGNELVAYVLVLDGGSTNDSPSFKTLGMAYGPTSTVLFQKSIQDSSGGIGQPTRTVLESTVIEHEFGHLLDLVRATSHKDSAHGAHCSNTSCLMYYETDTSDFLANLLGGTIPTLDSDCISDLQANGGK